MRTKPYFTLENAAAQFGDRTLFHIDHLIIYEGDRIGLVGMNGTGKTTLLRMLAGDSLPDEGVIHRTCQPCHFEQIAPTDAASATPMELSLFGVQDLTDQDTISGGENTRLRLAEMFSEDRACLLLDEPTGNLDAEGIAYLNKRLETVPTFVLVSHDRDLLNRQCTRILEIENSAVTAYDGNYDAYMLQKQQARERAQTEYLQYTGEMARLKQVYMAKKEKAKKIENKPKGMSSSDAKVREFTASHRSPSPRSKAQMLERSANNVKQRMEHMEVKEKPKELPKIRPDFTLTDPPRNPIILEAEHLSFSYPDGKTIFDDAVFRLHRGTRTALLGPNGAGKTTLLRLIEEGNLIRKVPKATLGFFRQDMSDLDDSKTVLQSVMDVSVQKESVARTMLARLLFPAQDMHKRVSVLSGGERIRLCFARLFVSSANVLILDEPTNYLDIPSVEALQTLFAEYEGTLLFVSHDAAFVRTIATDHLLIRDKKILPYPLR